MTGRSDPVMVRVLMAALAISPVAAHGQPAAAPQPPPTLTPSPSDKPDDDAIVLRAKALRNILETNMRGSSMRLYWETKDDEDDYFVDRIKGNANVNDVQAYRKNLVAWGKQIVEMVDKGVDGVSLEAITKLQLTGDLVQQQFMQLASKLDHSAFTQGHISTDHQFEAVIAGVQMSQLFPADQTNPLNELVLKGLEHGISHDFHFGRNIAAEVNRLKLQEFMASPPLQLQRPDGSKKLMQKL